MVSIPKPKGLSRYEEREGEEYKEVTRDPFTYYEEAKKRTTPSPPSKPKQTPQEFIETKAEPKQQLEIKQAEKELIGEIQTTRKAQVPGLAKYGDPSYKKADPLRLAGAYARYQESYQRGYRSLTPQEKEEFGYKYTQWEKIPAEQIRQYPGGERYLQENIEPVVTRYIEEKGGPEKVPLDPFFYASYQAKYGYKPPRSEDVIRMQAKEQLLYTFEEQRSRQYSRLPLYSQLVTSGFGATVRTVAGPVVLGQTVIKLATGKQVGPDIGAGLKSVQLGPSGVIEASISEGVGVFTGRSPGEYKKISENPLGAVAATGGEVLGMLMLSGTVRGVKPYVASGFKSTVRFTPKAYTQFQKVFPKPVMLESGKQVGSPVLGKLYSGVERFGQTGFYQNIYGYATGRLGFVKTLPLKSQVFYEGSRTGVTEGKTSIFQVTRKFSGIPRTRLVPKVIGERYQLGDVISMGEGAIERTFMGKPTGFLLKKAETYTGLYKRISDDVVGLAGNVEKSPFVRGGFIRSPDEIMTTKFLEVKPSKFIRSGFVRQEPKIDIFIARKGFKGFIWSDEAAMSVTPQVQIPKVTPGIGFGKTISNLGKLSVNIPSTVFSTGFVPISGLFVGSVLASELSIGQVSTELPRMDVKQNVLSVSIPDVISQSVPVSVSMSGLNQMQQQMQKQSYKIKTVSVPQQTYPKTTPSPPSIVRSYGASRVRIPRYIPSDEFDLSFKKIKKIPSVYKKGYRFREWKVPTLKQLLGV